MRLRNLFLASMIIFIGALVALTAFVEANT